MVDALSQAQRVLTSQGVLIDVHPVIEPIMVEVVAGTEAIWAKQVDSFSAPDDVTAANAAVEDAVSQGSLVFETSARFLFDIYCDSAAELQRYAEGRKLRGAEIPYEELEDRQRELTAQGKAPRLRCRRPWMLSAFRKRDFKAR